MKRFSRRFWWWSCAAWALTVFLLSSIPGRSLPNVQALSYDKALHAIVYSVLGGLFFRAARQTWALTPVKLIAIATLAAALFGVTDEIHQLFVPGRSADPNDVLADLVGGAFGASLMAMASAAAPRDELEAPRG